MVPPPDTPLRPDTFDAILLDVPWSNTGVLRRRIELRWCLLPTKMKRIVSDQLGILRQAAPLVKPGGCLVYSTCSLGRVLKMHWHRLLAKTDEGIVLRQSRISLQYAPSSRLALVRFG